MNNNNEEKKKGLLNNFSKKDKETRPNMEVPKKKLNKSLIIGIVVGFILGGLFLSGGDGEQIQAYEEKISKYEDEISDYKTQVNQLNEKVEEAAPWFEMEENEQKEVEKANEEKKIAEEKAKKKEAEEKKKAAEEKEKKGYDTGITYKQLARTPDDYEGEKIKFNGKVIQVMEGDGVVQIRLAVGGDYDNIMLCEYLSSTVDSRVLEDDYITVYGSSTGLITYTSTMGGEITIPSMLVMKIDQ